MKNRTQNNHNSWHRGVDQLTSLSNGSNPVNENSWARLEHRLNAKHRSATWYYWAAAALFVSIMIWQIIPASQNKLIIPVVSHTTPGIKIQPVAVHQAPLNTPGNRNNIPVNLNGLHTGHPTDMVVQQMPVAADTTVNKELLQSPDTMKMVAVATETKKTGTIKKRVPVMHVNDFTETIESTPGMTLKIKPLRQFLRPNPLNEIFPAITTPVKTHTIYPSTIQN